MKRFKKVLCFVLPLVLVVAIAIGVILPASLSAPKEGKEVTFGETNATSAKLNGVVYAADSTSGAATAAKDYKGGAIFLEPNSTFNMSGGTISGHKNTYGGAIYISDGATFTMTAGTISGNTATYGGAIYVENGGKCYIRGGEIKGNKATSAPAIYVETGGTLEVSGEAKIEDNKYLYVLPISTEKEQMGGIGEYGIESSVELYTTTFGNYPQTYVGDGMNATLESWFGSDNPAAEKTYTIRENDYNTTGIWPAYKYTDGELYVRERSYRWRNASSYTYKNGDAVPDNGTYVWFKVEPIKWYIMNYEAWQNGSEEIELYSAIVLTANIPFDENQSYGGWEYSGIRSWCNEVFYNDAFTDAERGLISLSTIKNNVADDFANADSDGKGPDTQDHIYLKSYYEMTSGIFVGISESAGNGNSARICAPSDFALSNYVTMSTDYTTPYRGQGTCYYTLRSVGRNDTNACDVNQYGSIHGNASVVDKTEHGIRPAMRLAV